MAIAPSHRPPTAITALGEIENALSGDSGVVTHELIGADREQAITIAQSIERLAHLVGHLQVIAAAAVAEAMPPTTPAGMLVDHGAPVGGHRQQDTAPRPDQVPTRTGADGLGPSPYRRPRDLLRARLLISGAEAGRRLRLGRQVMDRLVMTGEILPPRREHIAAALPHISVESAREVERAITRVEAVTSTEEATALEELLCDHARTFDTDQLRQIANHAIALADPDGAEPSEYLARTTQGVHIGTTRQGLTTIRLVVDTLQLEVLKTIFDAGTNPRTDPLLPLSDLLSHGDGPAQSPPDTAEIGDETDTTSGKNVEESPTTPDAAVLDHGLEGAVAPSQPPDTSATPPSASPPPDSPALEPPDAPPEERTRPQRQLDALIAAALAALRAQALPRTGGTPTQLIVTIDAETLCTTGNGELAGSTLAQLVTALQEPQQQSGPQGKPITHRWQRLIRHRGAPARLQHAGPVPAGLLRRLACDADIIPVVLATNSRVLDLGQTHRLFPPWMRAALIARDGGCAFPGCTIPASWCEAHHITPWHQGGTTSTDNGVLLCPYHHHLVHTGEWTLTQHTPGTTPTFTNSHTLHRSHPNRYHHG